MALQPGQRLGPYEIEATAGVGGMGEVYRARDTRLDRTVAVKVLPEHRAEDAAARARLEREAKSISSLSHPGICALFDIGHEDGVDYLVMEYLEGETLAQRIASGPLPAGEALEIAVQIADGLAAAHRQGFVHRDLKPGNVMLTRSGAKLLDFGLAKALDSESDHVHGLTAMATATTPLTANGTILGTFQYMSPEQLEGSEADARSDLFAFGAMLYEMLTGKHAFEGKSQASLAAAILKEDPRPVSAQAPASPPAIDRLVQRCLAKDPDKRWHSASDLGHELSAIIEGTSVVGAAAYPHTHPHAHAPAAPARSSRLPWAVAALFALLAVVLGGFALRSPAPESAQPVHFNIAAPEGELLRVDGATAAPPVVSPDGRHLVFGAYERDGSNRLWLRSLDSVQMRPIQGSEDGHRPFWSPDSRFVAFFAGDELRKAEITGGPALPVCEVEDARGGAWAPDGTILFAPGSGTGLFKVAAGGGTPQPVTNLDLEVGRGSHRYPFFLPDGRSFVYLVLGGGGLAGTGAESENQVWVTSLDGGEPRMLLQGAANAEYLDGELFFFRGGALMAQPFDPETLVLSGEVRVVIPEIQYDAPYERGIFSTSSSLLAYRAGGIRGLTTLYRFEPNGVIESEVGAAAVYTSPALSPDGKQLAVAITTEGSTDIWVQDLASGRRTRLTFAPAENLRPAWSPDGRMLAYSQSSEDGWHLIVRPAAGEGEPRILAGGPDLWPFPAAWTGDGKSLVFLEARKERRSRIGIVDVEGGEARWILEHEGGFLYWVRLSPDQRWISYASNRTGRWEVYVTSFPSGEGRWQISTAGGLEPLWSVDGKALYYRAGNGTITRVEIDGRDGVPRVGEVVPLFDVLVDSSRGEWTYDVDAEGRIVVSALSEKEASVPLTAVLNWK